MQTLSRRLDMTLAAVILIGCTAVIQYHAIQFWTAQVDPVTGWAWSLLLEAVALWLWWRRGIIRALALLPASWSWPARSTTSPRPWWRSCTRAPTPTTPARRG
ncbi:MAG: hypothetical protein ACLFTX_06495 [Thiohalospira sp.]